MSEVNLKRRILTAGILMIFCYGLVNNTVGFFVTPVSEALGCSRAAFNFYYSIACIVSLLSAPVFGQLLQKYNARHILLTGWLVGGAAMFAFSLCGRIGAFYPVAAVLGLVQQGTTSMIAMVLVNRAWAGGAGSATGLAMSGTGICSTGMSFVLPALIERFGWQQGYRLQSALWLALMGTAWLLTKNTVELPGNGWEQKSGTPTGEGVTLAQAMRGKALYLLFVCFLTQVMVTIVVQHVPSYLTEIGRSTAESSVIMAVFSAVLIAGKLLLGAIFDRWGAARTLAVNFLSLALGMWLMLPRNTLCLYAGVVLLSFGMSSVTVLFPLVTGVIFGKKEYAAIWGILSMGVSCGSAAGSPLWGAIFDHFGSYRPGFAVMPVVVLIDACVILWVMRHTCAQCSKV